MHSEKQNETESVHQHAFKTTHDNGRRSR